MAYASDESGTRQIYVQAIPADGDKRQISTAGGDQPRWRRDGHELFYIVNDQTLMAAPVKTVGTFETDTPRPLFQIDPVNLVGFRVPASFGRPAVSRDHACWWYGSADHGGAELAGWAQEISDRQPPNAAQPGGARHHRGWLTEISRDRLLVNGAAERFLDIEPTASHFTPGLPDHHAHPNGLDRCRALVRCVESHYPGYAEWPVPFTAIEWLVTISLRRYRSDVTCIGAVVRPAPRLDADPV
jgi:hypothetical protein